MSFAAFVWAWQQPTANSTDQHVLLALANIAPIRETYASATYIAEITRRSERHVRRSLASLEAGQFITMTERPGRTDLIRLNIPADFVVSMPPEGDLEKGKRGRPRKPKTPDIAAENPGHIDVKPSPQVSDEPKRNLTEEPKMEAVASLSPSERAFNAYNLIAERHGKSPAKVLNDQRRSAINARIKDAGGLGAFLETLGTIEQSPFLMGLVSGRNGKFRISLDFILQPSSFAKLAEGFYHEERHGTVTGQFADAGFVHDGFDSQRGGRGMAYRPGGAGGGGSGLDALVDHVARSYSDT